MTLSTTVDKVVERTFRAFWNQVRYRRYLLLSPAGLKVTERTFRALMRALLRRASKPLRYHRFVTLNSAEFKVPEGKFRAFWQQVRDPEGEQAR
jgi:hypothetical protein